MALKNSKWYQGHIQRNAGIELNDQIELVPRATAPTDSDLSNGRIYYDSNLGALRGYIAGSWKSLGAGAGAGASSWDEVYSIDKILALDSDAVTFAGEHASNDVFVITNASGTGTCLQITQSGSGDDIAGTSDNWKFSKTGALTCVGITNTGDITTTGGDVDWDLKDNNSAALSFDAVGKSGILVIVTSDASEGVTMSATLAVTGELSAIGASNTVSNLIVTNNTITDFGNDADSAGMVVFRSTSLTSGAILQLQATEATLNTGFYLVCRNVTATANNVLTIGEDGEITIAGAASNMLTITLGDISLVDGSITVVDADNSSSLKVTNDNATNASVFVFAGAGTFTGTTTTSFFTITASGLTTGTAVYIPGAAMTQGKLLHLVSNALTTGKVLHIEQDGEAMTSGELLTVKSTQSGNLATKSGNLVSFTSDVTETAGTVNPNYDLVLFSRIDKQSFAAQYDAAGSVVKILKKLDKTSGSIVDAVIGLEIESTIANTALPLGDLVKITEIGVAAKALNIISASTTVSDVLITGSGVKASDKATLEVVNTGATAAGGSILRVTNTGTPAAATSYLVDFDYTGATMTNNPVCMLVSGKDTTAQTIEVLATGAGADNKGVLSVTTTGATATGGSVLRVSASGTPAAATAYLVDFDYTGMTSTNNPVAVRIASKGTGTTLQLATSGAQADGILFLESTETGTTGVVIKTAHTSTGARANSDIVFQLEMWGLDSGDSVEEYGRIDVQILSTTDGSESSQMRFYVTVNGTSETALALKTNTVIAGAGSDHAVVTSSGAYDLTLSTNEGSNSGTIVITDGANNDITITPDGTGLTRILAPAPTVTSHSSTTTLTEAEGGIILVNTGTAFTVTLPAASGNAGLWYCFKKTDAAANALTIDGNASENIDGSPTHTGVDAQYDTLTIVCDGSNWHIIAQEIA